MISCLKEHVDILYVNICMDVIVKLFLYGHYIQQKKKNNNCLPPLTVEICFYLCVEIFYKEQKFLICLVRIQLKLFNCMIEQLMTHSIQKH